MRLADTNYFINLFRFFVTTTKAVPSTFECLAKGAHGRG